jgi:hypothetical protein
MKRTSISRVRPPDDLAVAVALTDDGAGTLTGMAVRN